MSTPIKYYLNELFDSQEEIRHAISSELHDNICSRLSILKWSLSSSNEISANNLYFLDTIIQSIRKLSHDLYSPVLEYAGILEAIRAFVQPLSEKTDIEIQVLRIEETELSNNIKLHVFRIFQEVICNIVKYANATKILIQLKITYKSLFMKVSDNGVGFLPQINNEGIGLKTIEYRARLINAIIKYKHKGNCFLLKTPI